ncbi:MAG TPA: hypothetical protein VMZ28_17295 [Kofleriaceae bacterium]|nr:hypothetical protein [Kofleriaceae bacterium]
MLRTSLVLCGLLGLGAAGTGCVAHGTMRTHAYVETASPDLVYVSPGVYVVADYDEPVFYSSGSYWLYRDGFWFRSRVHTGGWARAYSPPVAVRSIHRPTVYVRYRASGRVYRHDNRGRVFVRGDRHRPVRRHYR